MARFGAQFKKLNITQTSPRRGLEVVCRNRTGVLNLSRLRWGLATRPEKVKHLPDLSTARFVSSLVTSLRSSWNE